MEEAFEAQKILLTHSCTAALEMAAILCEVQADDEVILPSYTFVSTANAFYLRGAKLVFVDIREDTLNIDEGKIEKAVSAKTKVIVPVHYAGVACEMESIMDTAKAANAYVVEDAAQAVNSKYREQYLGTFGDLGTYSFHETKNFISGEGGAIVINNERLLERAEIIREKGTNRKKFFRGEVDKYTWVDIGSSYLPSDLIAAFLYAQLENMDQINHKRKELFNFYLRELSQLAEEEKLRLPYIPAGCNSNYHLFHIILNDEDTRNRLMDYLKANDILAVFHYIPLHVSTVGHAMGYRVGDLPVSESLSSRLLRLPLFYDMRSDEQHYVVEVIKSFFNR